MKNVFIKLKCWIEKFYLIPGENYFVLQVEVVYNCSILAVIGQQKGIHIITPNKKANFGPLDQVMIIPRQTHLCYCFHVDFKLGIYIY